MNKIAKFEKVSFEQFKKDWMKNFPDCTNVKEIYNNIKLPKRANQRLFLRAFVQKSPTAGCLIFFRARVSALSTEFSLTTLSV